MDQPAACQLPFDEHKEKFLDLVRNNQVIILAAETGAGKSTKAPLALLNAGLGGDKMIVVTEPRRVAAINLAKWVTKLHQLDKLVTKFHKSDMLLIEPLESDLGDVIGYQIGHDRQTSRSTKLAYKTEGVLLAELHSDKTLSRYSIICLDEVHERGVNQDLLLALVKSVLPKRPDLKVVVMSATINTEKFSKYFGNAPVLTVPGRVFPVDVRYARTTPENGGMLKAMVAKIDEILLTGEAGDILAFLPDQDSIMKVVVALEKELGERASALRILPLFGQQAPDDQMAVFVRDEKRRVIVSTNIAETSLTIDGVRHVVDSGLIKAVVYVDASMSALQVTEHSRAGCDQRAGRAGRTQDGICHRLFTREDYLSRVAFTKPEILRMSLDQVLLQMRCLGYTMDEVLALDLMDKPDTMQWHEAEDQLKLLGAISVQGEVTKDGQRMNRFPVEPMIGRMILEGERLGCLADIFTIAACFTATRPIFVRPKGSEEQAAAAFQAFRNPKSDALTMWKAWKAWDESQGDHRWAREHFLSSKALVQVDRIRDRLWRLFKDDGIEITFAEDEVALQKAVASGLLVNLARKNGEYNYSWNEQTTFVFPGSAVMGHEPLYLVCAKVVESTTERTDKWGNPVRVTRAYMRNVQAIESSWISELIPADAGNIEIRFKKYMFSDMFGCHFRRTLNSIELESKVLEEIPEAYLPHVVSAVVKQLSSGYEVQEVFPCLANLWNRVTPKNMWLLSDKERQKALQPMVDAFSSAMRSKLHGDMKIWEVVVVIDSLSAENVLTGDALRAYQQVREAEKEIERKDREERARQMMEEQQRLERLRAELVPLKEEFVELDSRVHALGYRFGCLNGNPLSYADRMCCLDAHSAVNKSHSSAICARLALDAFRVVVERLERESAPKFEATQTIYAQISAAMPVCPLCGGAWDDQYVCANTHSQDQIMARPEQDDRFIGSFLTDREEVVANVRINMDACVQIQFVVQKTQPWNGKVFKTISFKPYTTILPKELVEHRELILLWLSELNEAKRALEAELVWVEELRRGVAKGEIIALTFRDRGDGFMVANWGRHIVDAPANDLNHYPAHNESWWCHVIPGSSHIQIALFRKVGATRVDIDKILQDGVSMFPGLPASLLQ